MSRDNWSVCGVRYEDETLVLNVKPGSKNRKKFEGEIGFEFSEENLRKLLSVIENRHVRAESIEKAETELEDHFKEIEASFDKKKQEVADRFGISKNEISGCLDYVYE